MSDAPPQPHDDEPGDDTALTGLRPPLSPGARAQRLAVSIGAVVLVLVVIAGTIPALREGALSALAGPTPTATAPSVPDPMGSSFYFLVNPPWVQILVDGHQLTNVPIADLPAGQPVAQMPPLRLAHGIHTIAWSGAPFQPQHCTLPVPIPFRYDPGATDCALQQYAGSPSGFVVLRRESLATLPPDQESALLGSIVAGLNEASPSAALQPGEYYLTPTKAFPFYDFVTSRLPLRATLRIMRPVNSQGSEPCNLATGIQPCRFPGQDCRQLCTVGQPIAPIAARADRSTWTAAAPVQASWEFTDANGRAVGQGSASVGIDYLLVLLRITWDGVRWQVVPLFGRAAGGVVADDLACGPARDWLATTTFPSDPLVPSGPPLEGLTGGVVYVSGPDPTDGCFVSVAPSAFAFTADPPITQPATFLLRFGVLLAVNAVAHEIGPVLPVANAHEQAIAAQLQALANPAG